MSDAAISNVWKENQRLIVENTRLREALVKIAQPALGGKQQQWLAQEALKPLTRTEE